MDKKETSTHPNEISKIKAENLLVSALEKEIIKELGDKLKVPERLINPDKLIIAAKNCLEKNKYRNNGNMEYTTSGVIRICATTKNIGRALRFMDTFIKVIQSRGHELQVAEGKTIILIQGEKIPIELREKLKRISDKGERSYPRYEYEASGVLSFITNICIDHIEWKDGKSTLEEQLPRIIAKLEVKGEKLKKERIEREAYWAKQKEIERIKALEEERKDNELLKFQQILQEARRHNEADFLRKYLNGIEESAIKLNSLSDEVRNWLIWGRKKADWYDPLVSISDELMEDVDKNNLTRIEKKEKNSWIIFNNY